MKKFYYMMLGLVASLMMTSCSDDVERSVNLSGSWTGNLNMYYGIEDRHGHYHEFDAYASDIVFYPDYDYATHGYGKQVDWYDEGPYEKQYYHFDWEIRNGVIYLYYPYDQELNTVVCDYRMTRDTFSGYFQNSKYKFHLHKIADYYDWNCYYDDYCCWGSVDWDDFWDKPVSRASENADSSALNVDKVVKRGRRAAE